jgi:hypothetical protein
MRTIMIACTVVLGFGSLGSVSSAGKVTIIPERGEMCRLFTF